MCPRRWSGGAATANSVLRAASDRRGVADADALDARCVGRRGDAFADRVPLFGVDDVDVDGILPPSLSLALCLCGSRAQTHNGRIRMRNLSTVIPVGFTSSE